MGIFEDRKTKLPIWFMRQAGRYHNHYREFKKKYNFIQMCKTPKLATEVTMGPINEFGFDAAILFSDILFPLERLGFGLQYNPAPKLSLNIKTKSDVKSLSPISTPNEFYQFQKAALLQLKEQLSKEISLIGFVGAPFTLYTYAVEGSHAGGLYDAKKGLYNGCFDQFQDLLVDELITNMSIQAEANIDAMALFDTAAGELSLFDYEKFVLPLNKKITAKFKEKFPHIKLIYYSKHTNLAYLHKIQDKNIDVLGIDWRIDMPTALRELSSDYYLQGNLDPAWLQLEWPDLEQNLSNYMKHILQPDININRWIFNLGHGVHKNTPQENVKRTIDFVRSQF